MMHFQAWLEGTLCLASAIYLLPILLAQKALAAYNAGQPLQTVRWARRALACPSALTVRVSAHHAAGLGMSELGRLSEAETHYQQAYQLAVSRNRSDLAARSLVLLGTMQANRGDIEEALATARQAAEWSISARRDALVLQSDWLRVLGHWDAALLALQEARVTPPLPGPLFERRSQGILSLGLAWTEAATAQARGDGAAAARAWDHLGEARDVFAGDRKLTLWCEATASWLLALRGQGVEAARIMAQARADLTGFAESRATQMNCLSMLGRAAYLLGDAAEGIRLWSEFLGQKPTLPSQTRGLYYLGECQWQSGQSEAAENTFRQTLFLGIDTYYTQCARHRLGEMGISEETPKETPAVPPRPDSVWPPPPSYFP